MQMRTHSQILWFAFLTGQIYHSFQKPSFAAVPHSASEEVKHCSLPRIPATSKNEFLTDRPRFTYQQIHRDPSSGRQKTKTSTRVVKSVLSFLDSNGENLRPRSSQPSPLKRSHQIYTDCVSIDDKATHADHLRGPAPRSASKEFKHCSFPGIPATSKNGEFLRNKPSLAYQNAYRQIHRVPSRGLGKTKIRAVKSLFSALNLKGKNSPPSSSEPAHLKPADLKPAHLIYTDCDDQAKYANHLRGLRADTLEPNTPIVQKFLREYQGTGAHNQQLLVRQACDYLWNASGLSPEQVAEWVDMFTVTFNPSRADVDLVDKANALYGLYSLWSKHFARDNIVFRYVEASIEIFRERFEESFEKVPDLRENAIGRPWIQELLLPDEGLSQAMGQISQFRTHISYSRELADILEHNYRAGSLQLQQDVTALIEYASSHSAQVSAPTKTASILLLFHIYINKKDGMAAWALKTLREAHPPVLFPHDLRLINKIYPAQHLK